MLILAYAYFSGYFTGSQVPPPKIKISNLTVVQELPFRPERIIFVPVEDWDKCLNATMEMFRRVDVCVNNTRTSHRNNIGFRS